MIKTISSIATILANYQPVLLDETPIAAAVMMILLIDENEEIDIVLTKRADNLPTYAGHYSFPGGMRDPSDPDLYQTAVREVYEELNLPAHAYQAIGQLDDFQDHEGHLVRPFVAYMKKADFKRLYKQSTAEVAELYYFPLNKLNAIHDDPTLHAITRRRPSYAFREGHVFVWGLTATILIHFLNVLMGHKSPLGKIILP